MVWLLKCIYTDDILNTSAMTSTTLQPARIKMTTYIVNDIDGDAVQQIAQGTVDQLAEVFAGNPSVLAAIGQAAANGEATAKYTIDGEKYTTKVVASK